MKLILLLMLVAGAAVCSMASPGSWERRHARQEALRAKQQIRRSIQRARHEAFLSKMEMRREREQFLRDMRRQKREVQREVRDAFRDRE
jgi:hypothetical protein